MDSALATAEETPCPYLPILYRRALPLTTCTSLTSLATPVAQLLITVASSDITALWLVAR